MSERLFPPVLQEAIDAVRTDRGAIKYRHYLNVDTEHFAGRSALDVGAGDSNFIDAMELTSGIVAKIDVKYGQEPPLDSRNGIAGLMQSMPFKDNTFDEVVNFFGLYWLQADVDKALLEMMRVTTPNGHIHIHPAAELHPNLILNISPSIRYIPGTLHILKAEDLSTQQAVSEVLSAYTFNGGLMKQIAPQFYSNGSRRRL